jgi:transcriptional regulator
MTQTIVCAQCSLCTIFDNDDAIVHYLYSHVEHEDCYFDHHPHNMICLVCDERPDFLVFKIVKKIVFIYFSKTSNIGYISIDNANPQHSYRN